VRHDGKLSAMTTAEPGEEALQEAVRRADEETAEEPVTTRTVYRWGVAGALGVLTVYLGYKAVILVADVLVQVVIAAFIAISLDPAVRWLNRHRVRREQAVAIIFLALAVLVGLFLLAFLPPLIKQGNNLVRDFPGYLNGLRERSPSLRSLEDRFHWQHSIENFARTVPSKLGHEALSFSQRFLGALLSALLVLVLTIYFMLDLPRLRRGLVRLFPKRHRRPVNEAVNIVIDKVGSYMIGNLIVSAIAGVATFAALTAFRIPFALPLAVWVAITDLIPMVGASLGAVVCVIVAFATASLWPQTVLVVLFFVLYQQVENYLIVPRVMRSSVQMPAVAVLLAALLGGSVLGLVGALMAIPVAAAFRVIAGPLIRARDEEPVPTDG
jgi:predicted PurR-regulated permease PerM